jgi:hypothetical protein
MSSRLLPPLLLSAALAGCETPASGSEGVPAEETGVSWRDSFPVDRTSLRSSGKSAYFDLTPGARSVFEHGKTRLTITVLEETRIVDQVETRVVEEREEVDGKPREISRNFFAIEPTSGDIYYFGEEVDIYKRGGIVDHTGCWVAGVSGARFGLALPGHPKLGDKYFQEFAPAVAMDRGEIVGLSDTMRTPAGTFEHCLHVSETTPIERDVGDKWYAPGVGLVRDDDLLLVSHTSATH